MPWAFLIFLSFEWSERLAGGVFLQCLQNFIEALRDFCAAFCVFLSLLENVEQPFEEFRHAMWEF